MDCAICQESCLEGGHTHKLPCCHEFHTDCIISWFRSGQKSCPICREEFDNTVINDMKYMRRLTKMKSCPAFIKDAVADYDKIKKELNYLESLTDKPLKKKIKSKRSILKNAKNQLCNMNIFILPIRKSIFTD